MTVLILILFILAAVFAGIAAWRPAEYARLTALALCLLAVAFAVLHR